MSNAVKQNSLTCLFSNKNRNNYQDLNQEMSFSEYLDGVIDNPGWARSSYQRLYDMINEAGTSEIQRHQKTLTRYHFFDHPDCPIFGLEETLESIVKFLKGAAGRYGTERRFLLMHGPVGSSKSTICRAIKRGMERYSKTPDGAWFSYKWVGLPVGQDGVFVTDEDDSPMNEDPLLLLPEDERNVVLEKINNRLLELTPENERASKYRIELEGEVNPRSRIFLNYFLKKYNGDYCKILDKHIRVVRKVYSESDRVGIGTFQPKDEKNQDATELTGDINYRLVSQFGSDSDGRAFNFDGEFNVANRGFIEFIEAIKLDKAFLYDLLGATQEHCIKPKKFPQMYIDEVIFGHTNPAEFQKLQSDVSMEAFRDRTVKVNVPYLTRWSDEVKVYRNAYKNVRQHIAPHTLEMAAFFAILTRLEDDGSGLDLRDKVKLYDGKSLSGYTEESVKEMQDKRSNEGMATGISARYIQDQMSAILSENYDYVSFFMLASRLKSNLRHSSLISDQSLIAHYELCIDKSVKEYDHILKKEVQKALVSDENAIERLCNNYLDNLVAYVEKKKVRNPITGNFEQPNERLMRTIEEKIGVTNQSCDDFRTSISTSMGNLSHRGEKFRWDSNEQLRKALEAKLFEDTKDHIKLSSLSSTAHVVDPEQQEKIDALKTRLIRKYGYNLQSATDVLEYVSQIFARGDSEDD